MSRAKIWQYTRGSKSVNSSPRHSMTSKGSNWAFSDLYGVIVDSNFAELSRLPNAKTVLAVFDGTFHGSLTQSTPPYKMCCTSFPASYFVFLLITNRDKEIIPSDQLQIRYLTIRFKDTKLGWSSLQWLHFTYTTKRFKSDQVWQNKKISNPEKELKVFGSWFQADDIFEFCFYRKLESLDCTWVWTFKSRGDDQYTYDHDDRKQYIPKQTGTS